MNLFSPGQIWRAKFVNGRGQKMSRRIVSIDGIYITYQTSYCNTMGITCGWDNAKVPCTARAFLKWCSDFSSDLEEPPRPPQASEKPEASDGV